ncbi:phage head spike fiber domain-containing protein [Roseospira navarrensis]|uniref:DUF2793 domain-containing protein n=1 Tax=Roseospira navarrensis TaxID=140058 RepID=A0A7X1ZBG2_9PROT|nr:hypothetical protein [Roseospira navarrensis]MQX35471.1 hypothetical protein [Roseospira navarrensis]
MPLIHPTVHLLAWPDLVPSALSVTRAAAATRVTAFGRIETVAAGTLRHDFDPATGVYRGWLLEAARTNHVLFSSAMTDALWQTAAATVAAGSATAPDGAGAADRVTEDSATAIHTLYQEDLAFSAGQSYTLSIFARSAGRERLQLVLPSTAFGAVQSAVFDLTTGTVGFVEGTASPAIEALPDGWYRCAITATATTTVALAPIHFRLRDTGGSSTYAGDGTSGVHVWGAQVEDGAGATSFIATGATAVTRPADQVSLALGADAVNPREGSLLVCGTVPDGQSAVLAEVSDGSTANRIAVAFDTSGGGGADASVVTVGATVAALTQAGVSGGLESRCAVAYAADDFAQSVNGLAPATDTAGAVPSGLSTLTLGGGVGGAVGPRCWVRQVGLFPRRLPDADLQTVTL